MFRNILCCFILVALSSCNSENSTKPMGEDIFVPEPNISQVISSQVVEFNLNENNEFSRNSLDAFAKRISNVRILGLGEQTHGAGSVFSLKVALIKYLHQKHGFDLFILESGLYDVEKIYQQAKQEQRIKDLAPGNIFYMYANSEEMTPLFDYINEQANSNKPLKLVGFDSQHTGELSNKGLVNDLTLALKAIDETQVISSEWFELSKKIQQVLDGSIDRLSLLDEKVFFQQLDTLALTFSTAKQGFWHRISKGLIAQAKRQWGIEDNRSLEMGENVKWWAEQYPDKKIVVWAHTWHLTKQGNQQVNAGQVISKHFKDQYYMVHYTAEQGEYLDYVDMSRQQVASYHKNSLESITSEQLTSPINFIDIESLALVEDTLQVFSNDYQQTLPSSEWAKYFDGIFVFKEATPSSYLPEKIVN